MLANTVSELIQYQFPEFYQDEGPAFIAFVQAYYEWMETTGNPIHELRAIPQYTDIDTSIDTFASSFKNTYLNGILANAASSRAFTIKHIQDLYKSKGSYESIQLLFRLLFNTEATIVKPGDHTLRASSGIWKLPKYIEIDHNPITASLVGKRITGGSSNATAVIESASTRNINGHLIDVLYLSDLQGSFVTNEYITTDGNLANAPRITGSLSAIAITDGGFGNANGDLFDISGSFGSGGIARVSTTVNGNGQVLFTLIDGGSGFSLTNTVVTISNTVVFHGGNTFNDDGVTTNYLEDEVIEQDTYSFKTANNSIPVYSMVSGYAANGSYLANGIVYFSNSTVLKLSSFLGDFTNVTNVIVTGNSIVNASVTWSNSTVAQATVLAINSIAAGLIYVNHPFVVNAFMKGLNSNTIAITTKVSTGNGASFSIGSVSNNENVQGQEIGTILSLSNIQPGQNYDTPPMITIKDDAIIAGQRWDYIITIANTTGNFLPGQTVKTANGTTSGIIRTSNSTTLHVKRLLYADAIAANQEIISYFSNGVISGIASINAVANDTNQNVMGNNAVVTSKATSLSGVAAELEVKDSGLAYIENEVLTLTSQANSSVVLKGTAQLLHHGIGTGYWKDNSGKLDSDQYISDNEYYQDFSYEIQVDLSIDKYADVLKQLVHLAGSKMFGSVSKTSSTQLNMDSPGSSISHS